MCVGANDIRPVSAYRTTFREGQISFAPTFLGFSKCHLPLQ